jgi:hypothetical protein
LADTSRWAGGPNDDERKWRKLDNFVYVTDLVIGDATLDKTQTKIDLVDQASGVWKWHARHHKLEFADPKSDAEAFALPQWAPLLGHLRSLGLPMQRVRTLVRGERAGVSFDSLCVCDADEDGKVQPYRIWVLQNLERMPDIVCDLRSSRGPVPDEVAWCASPSAFANATAMKADKPVIKEGRFTRNFIGRMVADKVNDFLDGTQWATVHAKDPQVAQAVADDAVEEDHMRRVVWMVRGNLFVYATPNLTQGTDGKGRDEEELFTRGLVELQRKYARLNRA